MGVPTFHGVGLGDPPVGLTLSAASQQDALVLVTESATPSGGTGVYTYAWTLLDSAGTDRTALLSSSTAQNPTWTPDLAGAWVPTCTVTSGGVSTSRSREVVVGKSGWICRLRLDLQAQGVHDFKVTPAKIVTDDFGRTATITYAAWAGVPTSCGLDANGLTTITAGVCGVGLQFLFSSISGWTVAADEEIACFYHESDWSYASDWSWIQNGVWNGGVGANSYSLSYGQGRHGGVAKTQIGRDRGGSWSERQDTIAGGAYYSCIGRIIRPYHASERLFYALSWSGSFPAPESTGWTDLSFGKAHHCKDLDTGNMTDQYVLTGAGPLAYFSPNVNGASTCRTRHIEVWSRDTKV